MFCTACGTENSADSKYCAQCGAVLGQSGALGSAAPSGAPGQATGRPSGPDSTSIFSTGQPPSGDADAEFSTEAHQGAVDALFNSLALKHNVPMRPVSTDFALEKEAFTSGNPVEIGQLSILIPPPAGLTLAAFTPKTRPPDGDFRTRSGVSHPWEDLTL